MTVRAGETTRHDRGLVLVTATDKRRQVCSVYATRFWLIIVDHRVVKVRQSSQAGKASRNTILYRSSSSDVTEGGMIAYPGVSRMTAHRAPSAARASPTAGMRCLSLGLRAIEMATTVVSGERIRDRSLWRQAVHGVGPPLVPSGFGDTARAYAVALRQELCHNILRAGQHGEGSRRLGWKVSIPILGIGLRFKGGGAPLAVLGKSGDVNTGLGQASTPQPRVTTSTCR